MTIKVCGINDVSNYETVRKLEIDLIGFNFYPESKRYVTDQNIIKASRKNKGLVGVFVDEHIDIIRSLHDQYQFDYIQCHGHESVQKCQAIQEMTKIIKVFSISEAVDFQQCKDFLFADLFLFDTKAKQYGGSGLKFDWDLLDYYKEDIPFLLAGGISNNDINAIKQITHPQFIGIDINSKYEITPGIKDINMIETLINNFNQ
jgi:phosphoribosylanthranilate isomerase